MAWLLQGSLQQNNATEWNVLSQGSRELEGLLKLVSKERLQLERHFVLATQVLYSRPDNHLYNPMARVLFFFGDVLLGIIDWKSLITFFEILLRI